LNEEPNYLAHAFKSQYNLIGLATALGFAVLSASALPLVLAAGAQLAILPLVAGSERFQRLVKARALEHERDRSRVRKEVEAAAQLRALPDAERVRYRELQTFAGEIRENYRHLDRSSQVLVDDLVRKLDFLLSFYLRMRYSVARYESYFSTTDPERIQERVAMLEHELQHGPERIRQIKAKTRDVLLKRLERYEKALENRQLIDAQTETVLEVLQLLRDQSFAMRDPRTITEQLDGLVHSAEETERGVKDMEDLLATEQDLLAPGSLGADVETELGSLGIRASSPVRLSPPPLASSPPPPKKLTH
jgi:hypothetical protein